MKHLTKKRVKRQNLLEGYISVFLQNPWEILYALSHSFFSGFGQTFFIAFLIPFIQEAHGLSDSQFGTIFGVLTLITAAIIPSAGKYFDTINLKLYGSISLVFLCLGLILLGSPLPLPLIVFGLFLLRFSGQGLFMHISTAATARYFNHSRGKALTIVMLGLSLSEALLPIIFLSIARVVGWQKSVFLLATLMLISISIIYIFGLKKEHRFYQPQLSKQNPIINTSSFSILRQSKFLALLAPFVCLAFVLTGLVFHKIAIGDYKGWSQYFMAQCFLIFSVSKIVTSIFMGQLIDRFSAVKCNRFLLLPLIVAVLVLAVSNHQIGAIIYIALMGVTLGMGMTLQGALWAEIYKPNQLGTVKALLMQFTIAASAFAPPIFGLVFDLGINLNSFLVFLVCLTILIHSFLWRQKA